MKFLYDLKTNLLLRRLNSIVFSYLFIFKPFVLSAQGVDEIDGKISFSISDDFVNKKSQDHYEIEDKVSKKIYSLQFKEGKVPSSIKSGDHIKLKGRKLKSKEKGEFFDVENIQRINSSGDSSSQVIDEAAAVTGRTVVAILINFTDGNSYLSPSTVNSYLHGSTNSANHLFKVSTNDLFTFNPDADGNGSSDIFGPYNIPVAGSGTCNYTLWASEADKAATNAGVNLSLYQHRVYVLPSVGSCGWAGLGNMPGIRTWARAGGALVFAHELGHNLGMHHAATDTNNDNIVDSEYGDGSCIMGNTGLKGINGAHVTQLGVYSAFTGKVITGQLGYTELGAVDLNPLLSTLPQVLKIKKVNTNDYYYITYRAPYNYGVNLSATYSKRINIHRYLGSGSNKTTFIKSLGVGEVFSDLINGIEISGGSQSADGSFMGVTVKANCAAQPATLSVSPTTAYVSTNNSTSVNVTIKNNDSEVCPATTYSLEPTSSLGVLATLAKGSVSLLPGASQTISMSVTSSLSSGSGVVNIIAHDNDGLNPTHADVKSSNLTVTIDATAPSAPSNLSSTFKQNKVQLSWLASTDLGSGVASYLVYVNNVYVGSSSTTNFTHTPSSSGTYTYYVKAKDKAGNLSLSSNIHTRAVTLSGRVK